MRVNKSQIVNGFVDYIENEIIPQMSDDKSMQIIISVGVNMIKSNSKTTDILFDNPMVKAILDKDENGLYEIEGLFNIFEESVKKYGYFPVTINPIPIISPTEKTLKFMADDIAEIKKRIERSN